MVRIAQPADASEPLVYTDLFQSGTIPIETCQLHGAPSTIPGAAVTTPSTAASHTPNVDAALRTLAERARAFTVAGSAFAVRQIRGSR